MVFSERSDQIQEEKRESSDSPKLLAIQASPRKEGFTALLMRILLEGAKKMKDITIEEIFLPDQHLEFCRGCFTCKSVPYHCPIKDDMGRNGKGSLHEKIERINGLLITLPTYLWATNSLTHAFFERLYPFLWSQQLNGLPFAFVASAYNSGMHRESARMIEKWGFIFSLEQIGGMAVHFVQIEEVRDELMDLGKRLAEATIKDFFEGRREKSLEDKYVQALERTWDLPGLYLDNITEGTGRREDLLTTKGFQKGWFKYQEAFRFFQEADDLFCKMMDCMESGTEDEAMRLLARAHRVWKDGTFIEFTSRHR